MGADISVALALFRLPGQHVAAIGQGGHDRVPLFPGEGGIAAGLSPHLDAAGVVALGEDVVGGGVRGRIGPCDQIAAVRHCRDARLPLPTADGGVDAAFAIHERRHNKFLLLVVSAGVNLQTRMNGVKRPSLVEGEFPARTVQCSPGLARALARIAPLLVWRGRFVKKAQSCEMPEAEGTGNAKAAQCAAFDLVGPHGLEPWTKGL
ncbi:hypothetical protein D3C80_828230 [compost metagenome]